MTTIVDNVASNGAFPATPPTNWTNNYAPSKSGLVRIDVSASGFTNSALATYNLILQIDGATVKTVSTQANSVGIHGAFAPLFFSTTLTPGGGAGPGGSYVINATVSGAGSANGSDFCSIMVSEW